MAKLTNLATPNRQPLFNQNTYNLRLKNVFINFDEYKKMLLNVDVEEEDIKEFDYENMLLIFGNAFVKWKHINTARLECGFAFVKVLSEYKLNMELKKMDFEDLIKSENVNSVDLHATNQDNEDTNRKYLIGNNTTTSTQKASKMDAYMNLQSMVLNLSNPKEIMYKRFAGYVLATYQPKQINDNINLLKGGLKGYE